MLNGVEIERYQVSANTTGHLVLPKESKTILLELLMKLRITDTNSNDDILISCNNGGILFIDVTRKIKIK